jgi:hypothetical protein
MADVRRAAALGLHLDIVPVAQAIQSTTRLRSAIHAGPREPR